MALRYDCYSIRQKDVNWGCSTEELIKKIKEKEEKALALGGTDLSWNICAGQEYGDEYGYLELTYQRPKTAGEIKEEQKARKRVEQREKEMLEQLKKKYGEAK